MALTQTFLVLTALSGAVFSFPVGAQEIVTRGNDKAPYQPPSWVMHLVVPDSLEPYDVLSWAVPKAATVIGRPHPVRPKIACLKTDAEGRKKWAFCEL